MHWIWDYFDSLIQFDRRLQFLLDMLTLFPRCALLEIIEKNLAFLMHIWSRDTKGFRGFAFGERGLWVQKKIRDLLICWFTVLPPLPPSVIIQPFDDSLDWRQFMSFCDCGRIGSSAIQKGKQIQISSAVVWLLLFQPDRLAVQGFSSHDPKEERVAKNTTCIERAMTLTHRSHGDDSRHIGPDIAMPWLQAWDRCMLQLMWRRTTEITRSSGT